MATHVTEFLQIRLATGRSRGKSACVVIDHSALKTAMSLEILQMLENRMVEHFWESAYKLKLTFLQSLTSNKNSTSLALQATFSSEFHAVVHTLLKSTFFADLATKREMGNRSKAC